jgi:hypothetical protein
LGAEASGFCTTNSRPSWSAARNSVGHDPRRGADPLRRRSRPSAASSGYR